MRDDQRFQLVEFPVRRFVVSKFQRPFEVVDDRPEGTVDVVILSTAIDGETRLWRAGYAMGQRIKLLPGIVFPGHFINQK